MIPCLATWICGTARSAYEGRDGDRHRVRGWRPSLRALGRRDQPYLDEPAPGNASRRREHLGQRRMVIGMGAGAMGAGTTTAGATTAAVVSATLRSPVLR